MQCSITPPLIPMPPTLKKKKNHPFQSVLARILRRRKRGRTVSFGTFQPRSDSVDRLVFSIAKITPSSVTSGINFKQQSHSIFLGMCNMPRVVYCDTPFIMVVLFLYSTGSHRQNTIGMLLSRLNWKWRKVPAKWLWIQRALVKKVTR